VLIGGVENTVYLMVFVLSYSRLMYVTASPRPIDTDELIGMHDAAFRYFDGCPRECVYDQTKLVVIDETYRELSLNERFARYAPTVGFHIHACEGYDPAFAGRAAAPSVAVCSPIGLPRAPSPNACSTPCALS